MLKFYYSLAPIRPRSRSFSKKPAWNTKAIPVEHPQGRAAQAGVSSRSIRTRKVPAIVDGEAMVFNCSAILLYLSEKTGKFPPANTGGARPSLSWMIVVASGVGPYSGQAVHFQQLRAGKAAVRRSTATTSKRSVTTRILDAELRRATLMRATRTPSST